MRRNAYAAKMMAAKGAVTQRQKSVLVNRCITTIYQASAIALNDQFGFGRERISRFRDAMDGADADYADGKLANRYESIMGGEAYPAE